MNPKPAQGPGGRRARRPGRAVVMEAGLTEPRLRAQGPNRPRHPPPAPRAGTWRTAGCSPPLLRQLAGAQLRRCRTFSSGHHSQRIAAPPQPACLRWKGGRHAYHADPDLPVVRSALCEQAHAGTAYPRGPPPAPPRGAAWWPRSARHAELAAPGAIPRGALGGVNARAAARSCLVAGCHPPRRPRCPR
jgi:hypothetical protein